MGQLPDLKGLRPKLFSMMLIFLLSCIPISIVSVNIIHRFYFQPHFYWVFSTYTLSYCLFSCGYFLLFFIFAIYLYMKKYRFSLSSIGVSLFMLVLSIYLFYSSFDTYSYLDEKGLYINSASSIGSEEFYQWNEVKEIVQINNGGLPSQLEIILDDQKIKLNLQADWYAKRKGFYEQIREFNIPISSREKQ